MKYYKTQDEAKIGLKDYSAAASANRSNPVTRFAGDALSSLRDNVIVPGIDRAMEAGHIPSDAGMYARWATGTTKPLTRRPADIDSEVESHVNAARFYNREQPNGDIPIHRGSIYPFSSSRIKDSLGSYTVNEKENVIKDTYDFNYYNNNHPDVDNTQEVFNKALICYGQVTLVEEFLFFMS